MYGTYEAYIASLGNLDEPPVLCIGCRNADPEPGADHCTPCLDAIHAEESNQAEKVAA